MEMRKARGNTRPGQETLARLIKECQEWGGKRVLRNRISMPDFSPGLERIF